MQDYEELQKELVENVFVMLLDVNVFEWYCNFKYDDIIYYFLFFFMEKYLYELFSVEFVFVGFQYNSGVIMVGKVGIKVCLNIFLDFVYIYIEWKDQKFVGWFLGYIVQIIFLNVVVFFVEIQFGDLMWMKSVLDYNWKFFKGYKCDCGYMYVKFFLVFDVGKLEKVEGKKKKGK